MKKVLACAALGAGLTAVVLHGSRRGDKTFREILRGLTIGSDPEALLQRIAERAARLVHASGAYIERADPPRDLITSAAGWGEGLPPVGTRGPYRGSIAEHAIEAGTAIIIPNVRRESRSILGMLTYHAPAVVLPLLSANEILGVLVVIRKKQFARREISSLQLVADLAAISLRRAIILQQSEERRRELEQALRERDETLRIVSHDLRNPLQTIALTAESLDKPHLTDADRAKLHEIVKRSAARMNRMIQDLIDHATIEHTGALPLNPQRHDAECLVKEVCELTKVQADAKTVNVTSETHGSATILVDRDRLLQVLTNLVDNALKFTPRGGAILVQSKVTDREVEFSVSDTGPGIRASDRSRIFEPYWQAESTRHLGIGLGLTIAKSIVEQHGGRIWVESAESRGSRFVFTIPAKPENN
jgi:signal transduction histidine kinase